MSFNYYERVNIGDSIMKNENNGKYSYWKVTGFILHLGDLFMELINDNGDIVLVKGKSVSKVEA